jgi:hypothetical protein
MMARPITTVKAASARLRAAATTSPKDKADGTGEGKGKFYDGQPLSTYRIADGATVRPPVDP